MASEPMVSIGLSTYNREFYLKRAIDCLLGQTYKNIILTISDNASTDGTQALCEAYSRQDDRVRYIRQSQNFGQIWNANFALQSALKMGDFCMLASDDDIWESDFISACVKNLLEHPECVAAFSRCAIFLDDNTRNEFNIKEFFPQQKNRYNRLKEFLLFYSTEGKGILMYSVWRKNAIIHELFRDRYEDDVSFVLRGLMRGSFSLVNQLLFFKRLPKASIKDKPLTKVRLVKSFKNRFARTQTELSNISSFWTFQDLSLEEKIKLSFWNIYVIARLFVQRKT
jgi:glycosyltransferase involved in cell wall biosynthesis